jgi:hypothetical protein
MSLRKLEQEWINRIKSNKNPTTNLPEDFKGSDIDFMNSKLNNGTGIGRAILQMLREEKALDDNGNLI